jgi:hypothetical protein
MRRTFALFAVAAAASYGMSSPAGASLYCADLGPVPGFGPVCTARCVLGAVDPDVKDPVGTVVGVVTVVCPA